MKFLSECKADATADLVYRVCPMHLLEPAEFLKDLHYKLKNTNYKRTMLKRQKLKPQNLKSKI